MLKLIISLLSSLTEKQRRQYYLLQLMVIITALSESVAIASIVPFMTLVGDLKLLDGDNAYAYLYALSGTSNSEAFLLISGGIVLTTLFIGAVLSTLTNWRLSLFAISIGTQLGDRLYCHYMNQPWIFHTTNSSAQLIKQISTEAVRITDRILYPLMMLNARLVLVVFIAAGILIYDPIVAIVGFSLFGFAYLLLYKLVRAKLQQNSRQISELSSLRYRLMMEGFGGIKDITLLGRQSYMIDRFSDSGLRFANAQGTNNALAQVPRYFMELLAFGSIISLILYLVNGENTRLSSVLPTLSVYALAGFKILPALQQIYWGIASIKGGQSAFDAIKIDLLNSRKSQNVSDLGLDPITPNISIEIRDVYFSYPNRSSPVLNRLNLYIKANTTIGIVGSSGSGKTTTVDMLLGLLTPESGQLLIDGIQITSSNRRNWQKSIGYVPQNIFLSEGSIAENIAYGIADENINREQINKVLTMVQLDEMVNSLPDGINTRVGERGVQISGGQRQRLGIARALYHEPSVIVFDEATSALDGLTETSIMKAIEKLHKKKTIIIIAHRLKTIENCDVIYFIKNGEVETFGGYCEIIKSNIEFRKMAELL